MDRQKCFSLELKPSPDHHGSIGWASACKAKGHQFHFQLGRMPM